MILESGSNLIGCGQSINGGDRLSEMEASIYLRRKTSFLPNIIGRVQ